MEPDPIKQDNAILRYGSFFLQIFQKYPREKFKSQEPIKLNKLVFIKSFSSCRFFVTCSSLFIYLRRNLHILECTIRTKIHHKQGRNGKTTKRQKFMQDINCIMQLPPPPFFVFRYFRFKSFLHKNCTCIAPA